MKTHLKQPEFYSRLKEIFVDQLQDIYWAEKKMIKRLSKFYEAATSPQLKRALMSHQVQSKTHIERIEKVFSLIGEKPEGKKCPAMAGIIEEGKEIVDDTEDGSAQRDVGIILAAQKAEHYEIATYGGLAQLAKTMDLMDVKELLGQILEEEKQSDILFTQIAEGFINERAARESQAM